MSLLGVLIAAAVLAGPLPRPSQDAASCLVCHAESGLVSSSGAPVSIDPSLFAASVHGRAGIGCVACHRDLEGVEDFPHAAGLRTVSCAGCHAVYARGGSGAVHGTAGPRLAAAPVLCKDCHGHHDIQPSSDPRSPVHRARRPATCGRCHPGAGPNFAKGPVHEPAATAPGTAAGTIRAVYKVLIGVMGAFFLAYIAVDLWRSRRDA